MSIKVKMPITDFILYQYFKYRQEKIDDVIDRQAYYQQKLLNTISSKQRSTHFGKTYNFDSITDFESYKKNVPITRYEDIFPLIEKTIKGEQNILSSDKINWFAKSSGTSNDRSKYIPVSKSYLTHGHLKCAWDAASFIYRDDSTAKLFADKSLIMGGSLERLSSESMAGDISAIILHHFPKVGRRFYTPDFETALLSNWEEKIDRTAKITSAQTVTLLAGVPTWTLVLLKRILEITGKENISQVWPNLKSYLHGGVGFEPYRSIFRQLIPSEKVKFREVYNASEGYFAIQDDVSIDGMLLLCDHQIYYEFIPLKDALQENYDTISLEDLEQGMKYALVITNSSGLYRYLIGDIVQIITTCPVRIKVVGRLTEYLNVFGEELSVDNANKALMHTSKELDVVVKDFTVAPQFLDLDNKGGHEWLVEFEKEPESIHHFELVLDQKLRELNSDYDAKRSADLALINLKTQKASKGTFERWLRSRGKYGGQNKIPRLRNDRILLNEISQFSLIKEH